MKKNVHTFRIGIFILLLPASGLACALLAAPATVTPSPLPPVIPSPITNPLIGDWVSVDIDGSNQTLSVSGGAGGTFDVSLEDFGATVCGTNPATGALFAATANGSLTGSGNDLTGIMPLYCQKNPPTFFGNPEFHFTYDAVTDTLTDSIGVTWHRK